MACALLAVAAQSLTAQRVRGEVLQADGATPALGVVVVATRTDNSVAGRVLSTYNGAFDLPLPRGTYALSALRIGYRPTVVSNVAVADTGATFVRIVLSGAPVPLAAVDVRSADVCGTANDPQSRVVQVWTEARTALTAAALWSSEVVEAEWITFQRHLAPQSEEIRSQAVQATRSATTHAFRSWPAESLATRGYVLPDVGGGFVYHAPDPEVLLSDSFAESHCFHVEPMLSDTNFIGVGFTPQRGRGPRTDIEGKLWIDRASSELRWLEFSYTGLPTNAYEASPGGRVEFLRVPNGPWMVSRWQIRMPEYDVFQQERERGFAVTRVQRGAPTITSIGIGGGVIGSVRRRGELLYEAKGSGLAVQLVRPDEGVSVANAQVTLAGTGYAWRTDSTGFVRGGAVLDGRYTVQVATADMLAVGAPPVEHVVVVPPERVKLDSIRVPSARDIVRDACGGDAIRDGLAALTGLVLDSAGRPAAARAVSVSWLGGVSGIGRGVAVIGRVTNGAITDDAGAWHLCDVPRGPTISVHTVGDDGAASAEVVVPNDRWIMPVTLRTSRAAVAVTDTTAASLEVFTKDPAGMALGGTLVELFAVTGEQRKITTDQRGRAFIATFPRGPVRVRAKHQGYLPGDVMFTAAGGRNTVPLVLGQATLPTLDSTRVVGNRRRSTRTEAFETRLVRKEATASFTAADIARRSPSEISDLLRGVSGIRMIDSASVMYAQLRRATSMSQSGDRCFMRVILDGSVIPVDVGINVVRPSEIFGLEVYASAGRLPTGVGVSAQDAACGLIVILTGKEAP